MEVTIRGYRVFVQLQSDNLETLSETMVEVQEMLDGKTITSEALRHFRVDVNWNRLKQVFERKETFYDND